MRISNSKAIIARLSILRSQSRALLVDAFLSLRLTLCDKLQMDTYQKNILVEVSTHFERKLRSQTWTRRTDSFVTIRTIIISS